MYFVHGIALTLIHNRTKNVSQCSSRNSGFTEPSMFKVVSSSYYLFLIVSSLFVAFFYKRPVYLGNGNGLPAYGAFPTSAHSKGFTIIGFG